MSIDIGNLTPAPWAWEAEDASSLMLGTMLPDGPGIDLEHVVLAAWRCSSCQKKDDMRCMWPDTADADFIALARNAFDVMMRRGWTPTRTDDEKQWFVTELLATVIGRDDADKVIMDILYQDDPFTALVEADKWFRDREAATTL